MDTIKNNINDRTVSNIFTTVGCVSGLAAYDISKRVLQPSRCGGGCVTRTGYYVLMGTIALAVGQKASKFVTEAYNNYKTGKKE